MGKNLDGDVKQLRQRINDALTFEDQLQARVQSIKAEIEKWDRQADEAVAGSSDAQARYAIEQMQLAQQRLAIAEADLREHQLVTQELITRVNTLDAAVADAHRAEDQAPDEQEQVASTSATSNLTDALRDVREKITRAVDAPPESPQTLVEQPPADDQSVEDDLAKRLRRLSKPE